MTLETKAISSRNALRHGLTAEKLSLPDEDPQDRAQRATRIANELNPQSELQHHLVECVNSAIDRQNRCARALHGKLTKQQRAIRRRHKRKVARQVEAGIHLFHKGCPWKAILILRRSAEGCRWLKEHWVDIRERLTRYGILTEPDLTALLRLHGEGKGEKKSRSVTPQVCEWVYLALGTWPSDAPYAMTTVLREFPPVLVQQLQAQWPTRQAHGDELLRRIAAAIAELDARIAELEADEQADREDATLDAMMIADPKEADLHLRYAKDADRALTRALEEFWALKEQEAELGSADEADDVADEAASDVADESPPPEAAPAPPPVPDLGRGGEDEGSRGTPTEALRDNLRNDPKVPTDVPLISGGSISYGTTSGIASDISKPLCGVGGPPLSAMRPPAPPQPPPGR